MQQPTALVAYKWTETWFPPEYYVRICVKNRLVDTMDVLKLISTSHGAAKVLHTKHLGGRILEASAKTHGFLASDLKVVFWNLEPRKSKALPISAMVKILEVVQLPMVSKVIPALNLVLEKTLENAIVVRDTPETFTVTTNQQPTMQISPIVQETAMNAQERVDHAKQVFELQKITADAMEHANIFKRKQQMEESEFKQREEIKMKEHQEKKHKIEWKGKLELLDAKYKWATDQGKVQLADHIETLISSLE